MSLNCPKNLTITLAYSASGLAYCGIVIHREKACSESWDSHSQQTNLVLRVYHLTPGGRKIRDPGMRLPANSQSDP